MSFLREIKDFYRFFRQTPSNHKQIVFYAEHAGYYPNFEGLLKELFVTYEYPIAYITSDSSDPILKSNNKKLVTFYSNILLPSLLQYVDSKVVIMTLTDLNQYHIKRSVSPVHYVYVFHSLVSMHMCYNKGAFDHYDSILCTGAYQEKEFREYERLENIKQKQLVSTGYYRLERVHENYKKQKISITDKKTVLIAPSWGEKNVLELCGQELAQLLLDAGYKVIVRPHPQAMIQKPELMNRLKLVFQDNADFVFEDSVVTDDSLLKSDVLICDCSGVALEYALGTERPVLFLDVPVKVKNKEYTKLSQEPFEIATRREIGPLVLLENLSEVPETVERLISQRANYQKKLKKLREENIHNFGESSQIGAKHILKVLEG